MFIGHLSFFINDLFKSLVYYSIGLSVFLLLICGSSLYILDRNCLVVVCVPNQTQIFFQAC